MGSNPIPSAIFYNKLQVSVKVVSRYTQWECCPEWCLEPRPAACTAGYAGARGGEVVLIVAIPLLILIIPLVASCGGGKQAYDFGC